MHDRDDETKGYNKGRRSRYDRDDENSYAGWPPFIVGAFLAGGVGLLLATQTNSNLRGTIRRYVSRATDEVAERGREVWETAVERGKEYMENGRHSMSEAGRSARKKSETGKAAWDTAVERGKEYIESGRQATGEAGPRAREYGQTGKEDIRTGKEAIQGGKESSKEAGRARRRMDDRDYESDYTQWSAFVPGALMGAGVALLLAPQTGSELRGIIRGYASRATDEIAERGREAWDTAVERGKEYMETGRHAMSEAGRTAQEYGEMGKEAMGTNKEGAQNPKESPKEAGQEATTKR